MPLGHMRRAKSQIRLRIYAVWPGPSLSAYRFIAFLMAMLMYYNRKNVKIYIKSVVVRCIFSSLLTYVLTLDVYDCHINRRTIDLYLNGKIPKFNFRVDN